MVKLLENFVVTGISWAAATGVASIGPETLAESATDYKTLGVAAVVLGAKLVFDKCYREDLIDYFSYWAGW